MEEVIKALQAERDKTVKKLDKLDRIITDLNEMDLEGSKNPKRKPRQKKAEPRVKLPKKEESQAIKNLITEKWEYKTDKELREIIATKFNNYLSISRIKEIRYKLGLINPRGKPIKKEIKDEPEDDEEIEEDDIIEEIEEDDVEDLQDIEPEEIEDE